MKCKTCKARERVIRGITEKECFSCGTRFMTGGADYDNVICPQCADERGLCPVCNKSFLDISEKTVELLKYFKSPSLVAKYLDIPKEEIDLMVAAFYSSYPSCSLKEMEAKYGATIDALEVDDLREE